MCLAREAGIGAGRGQGGKLLCMTACMLLQWQPGDFLISDNLAVAHEASPQTQMSVLDVGLRVMHRTTVAGRHRLSKQIAQKQ